MAARARLGRHPDALDDADSRWRIWERRPGPCDGGCGDHEPRLDPFASDRSVAGWIPDDTRGNAVHDGIAGSASRRHHASNPRAGPRERPGIGDGNEPETEAP